MQKFYRFWKKDFTNKLIVLVVLLITAAVVIDILLLMKPTTSGTTLLEDLFPTPTTDRNTILTSIAATTVYKVEMATASVQPTVTTIAFTPAPVTPTHTPTLVPPTITEMLPASTLNAASTPTPTLAAALSDECIPGAAAQTGKVVDILDGSSIKVLIEGLVYTVRYLGVVPPEDKAFAQKASELNGDMVYGKEVSLIADTPEKDELGRLLRYVKVEDTFVNLEMIQQGLAKTNNTDTLYSCAEVFKVAEQTAREAKRGLWEIAP